MKVSTILLLCLSFSAYLFAQSTNLGRLPVKNYPKTVYQAGTQTWDMVQDKHGMMYFANNEGLVKYDGTYWETYPISNGTIVRSLALADNGRIYVGGQGEIGYFFPNENGHLTYYSLMNKLPTSCRNLADIWEIIVHKGEVFFQSHKYLLRLDANDQLTASNAVTFFDFMGVFNDSLYLQDGGGLFLFDGELKKEAPVFASDFIITSFLPISESRCLITTLKQGIFLFDGEQITPWSTSEDAFFKTKRIYCASLLTENQIAIGTSQGGIMILDENGDAIRHINRASGLQNPNVISVYKDAFDNLWCGLDNGIDYIEVQSAFSQVLPDLPLEGAGYSVGIKDKDLYFATSNGLYAVDWKSRYQRQEFESFKLVDQTAGQAWQLHSIGNDLFLGHHEGAFLLDGKRAKKITGESTWGVVPINGDQYIRGHYSGLSLLEKKNNNWIPGANLNGVEESCRVMVGGKNGHLWMTHPYRGVFDLFPVLGKDSVQTKVYSKEDGLPSNLNNYVFEVNNQVLFATESGVYTFNDESQSFHADTLFNNVFSKDSWVKYLRNDKSGNIWFVTNKEIGYLEVKDKGLTKTVTKKVIPELKNKMVGGFEMIYPYDDENVFFGAEKGFIHFNPKKYDNQKKPEVKVLLNKLNVFAHKDSTVAGTYFLESDGSEEEIMTFPPGETAYRFYYSAPWFAGEAAVQYQYKLDGLDEDWSEWSGKTEKEYTNLNAGTYTFLVRAKKDGLLLEDEFSFPFKIRSPWYATTLAKITYAFLLLSIFGGIIFAQRRLHEAVTAELKSVHFEKEQEQKQKVEQTEAELVKLRNEALEGELQFRQKELATNAMHLMQKGELLTSIKEGLRKAIKKGKSAEETQAEINKVINMMEQDALLDESWEQFVFHFDQVHAGFFTKLRQLFPKLTSYDQKMCAYLRMNLTTKEIASLLNISVRGVEGGRYRLRKKLNLDGDVNLVSFIQEI